MTLVASLLDGALALPATRLASGRATRAVADGDEDAVTLAAEAALGLLGRSDVRPAALVLASTSAPYDEGGSVQALAELLGLGGELVALELTASLRDGITALRVAASLARTGQGPVLVCAAHRARGEHDAGDGAAAALVGAEGGVAALRFGAARAEELRDRWRLAAGADRAEADPSFVWDEGATGVARRLDADDLGATAFSGPVAKAAARAERMLGGPGDPLVPITGVLGAAHPVARILLGLAGGTLTHVASAGGLVDAVAVDPGEGAAGVAARAQAALEAEARTEPPAPVDWSQLTPYASAPRSWRERGQDLRLEGRRCGGCGRLLFPPPETCPACGSRDLVPERLPRAGVVVTQTRDRVYPAGRSTGMAVVDLDGGGRFFGQVVPSGRVEIGDRVRLVPRRLHDGGGAAQYFWKLAPEGSR